MPILAFAVMWGGYTLFLHGWATIRGYVKEDGSRISMGDLVNVHGYSGPWGTVASGTASSTTTPTPDQSGECPPGYGKDPKTGKCLRIIAN